MSAAPAYNYSSSAYERERSAQPEISVVPGRSHAPQSSSLSPALVTLAKVTAVVLVAVALLGIARVTLSAAAVSMAIETQTLSSQIEEARVAGSKLEVTQSVLANPTRIKAEASAMGMAAPTETLTIDVSGDVVVTDEAGNLSLSRSIAVAAQNSEVAV